MSATAGWTALLARVPAGAHVAQLYRDDGFLVEAVALYAGAGLERGEGVLLVATAPHWDAVVGRLDARGIDVGARLASGQLEHVDAEVFLSDLLVDRMPDPVTFTARVEALLDRFRDRGFTRLRVFGELVNLAWPDNQAAALRMEELWQGLIQRHRFALLCGYGLDPFSRATLAEAVPAICPTHSHLIPVEDYARYEAALDRALADLVGPSDASLLRSAMAGRCPETEMPDAQAALLELRRRTAPGLADAVLTRMGRLYRQPAAIGG